MRLIIQVAARDHARAWAVLVRHSAGTALPDRTFIVTDQAAIALRNAGVSFREISRDADHPAAGC
jgi:hypothetical protein